MRFLLSMLVFFFLAAPACPLASASAPGGFEGPVSGAQAETVTMAKKLHQDSRVALTGHILSRVAGEKDEYIFSDDTGEMPVLIGLEQFQGRTVTPGVTVRLSGKIVKQASSPDTARLKVKLLEIIK